MEKFGKLTILNTYSEDWRTFHECLCDCGNIKTVRDDHLRSFKTTDCGCDGSIKRERNIGLKFGNLTVVKFDSKTISGKKKYQCECACGNMIVVEIGNLKRGNTVSCGCLSESVIAKNVKRYMIEKYNALTEYKIFRNPDTNRFLPFDIFIPKMNIFIEINGEQHYSKDRFNQTSYEFEGSQKRDKMKEQFAVKNGKFISIDLRNFNNENQVIHHIESTI